MDAPHQADKAKPDGLFWILSLFFFGLSLVLPAYYMGNEAIAGSGPFFMGWLGLIVGTFGWLANPLFLFASLIGEKLPGGATVAAWLALVLAASFFFTSSVPVGPSLRVIPVSSLGWGYYCWVTAIAMLAVWQTFCLRAVRKEAPDVQPPEC